MNPVPKEEMLTYLDEIKHLYFEGKFSSTEIAQKLNKSPSVICYHLRKIGKLRDMSTNHQLGKMISRTHPQGKGEQAYAWKGGRSLHKEGYITVYAPHHPRQRNTHVFEHILVWEQVHNKPLPKGWIVHHLNGVKSDNRPCNLLAMPRKGHHAELINQALKQRIRELEAENRLLHKALEQSQMVFYMEN